jgi:hypothetical protein
VLAATASVCLLAAPAQAEGFTDDFGPNLFDVAVLRPLTLLQLSASFGYLISPGSSSTVAKTNFGDAWDVFVLEPYERAIVRPLGAW